MFYKSIYGLYYLVKNIVNLHNVLRLDLKKFIYMQDLSFFSRLPNNVAQ